MRSRQQEYCVDVWNWDLNQCIADAKDGVKRLDAKGRTKQYEIYKSVQRLKPRLIQIVAPGGWGKTTLQQALAMKELTDSGYRQRQLILTPQGHIGLQFAKDSRIGCGKQLFEWRVDSDSNFCDYSSRRVIEALKNWLKRDPLSAVEASVTGKTFGFIAVASHLAFATAWNELEKELSPKKLKKVIHFLTVRLDESHHVSWVFDKNDRSLSEKDKRALRAEANNLGKFCQFLVNEGDATSRLVLTTATPYREGSLILTKGVYSQFQPYYYPLSEHWKHLGIRHFTAMLEWYKGNDPVSLIIRRIKAEPKEKHLIVVGTLGSLKRIDYPRLMKEVRREFPNKIIVDTVDQDTQYSQKRVLLRDGENVDIWITCMLGREGTDWVPCSRIHHTAMEDSKWLAIQTLYRMMRSYKGKTSACIRYYLPRFIGVKQAKTRDDFSNRVNGTLLLSDIEDMLAPWLVKDVKMPELKEDRFKDALLSDKVSLTDVLGQEARAIQAEVAERIDLLEERNKEAIERVVNEVLKETYGGKVDPKIAEALMRQYLRNWARIAQRWDIAELVSGVGSLRKVLDLVKAAGVDDVSVLLGAKLGGKRGWARFRAIYQNKNSWEAIYQSAVNG